MAAYLARALDGEDPLTFPVPIRLRRRLEFWTREDALTMATFGVELRPALVVPARTTLLVLDFPTSRVDEDDDRVLLGWDALVQLPSGRRVLVDGETLREHGYAPRA